MEKKDENKHKEPVCHIFRKTVSSIKCKKFLSFHFLCYILKKTKINTKEAGIGLFFRKKNLFQKR